jgi:hydroxymethylbilane synthase
MVASLDGQRLLRDQVSGSQADPEALGIRLAELLRQQGAGEILEQIFADVRPQT